MDSEDRTRLTLNLVSTLVNHLENRALKQLASLALTLSLNSSLQFFFL